MSLEVETSGFKLPIIYKEAGNREDPFCRPSMAFRTRGSDWEEDWMWQVRARSNVLITTNSRQMATSTLSRHVLRESCLESASAGAIFIPGVTCQTRLKSWRNRDHQACCRDSLQGSLTYDRFLWSVMMVIGCCVSWRY